MRCNRCKKFVFFRTQSGYCKECDIYILQEERRHLEEEERKRIEEEEHKRHEEEELKRRVEEERKASEVGKMYYEIIMQNFHEIITNARGESVDLAINDTLCRAWFPNYVLHTDNGKQFNVVGVLQIIEEEPNYGPVHFMCFQEDEKVNKKDTVYWNYTFFVNSMGLAKDEKTFLSIFEALRGKYKEKYNKTLSYPLGFSFEQMQFVRSINKNSEPFL